MKRRLSFAIAIIGHPKLVILGIENYLFNFIMIKDEPTTGLDPKVKNFILNLSTKFSFKE